jgi:hypothetical protein
MSITIANEKYIAKDPVVVQMLRPLTNKFTQANLKFVLDTEGLDGMINVMCALEEELDGYLPYVW